MQSTLAEKRYISLNLEKEENGTHAKPTILKSQENWETCLTKCQFLMLFEAVYNATKNANVSPCN